jgi:hypothetical protein
MTQAAVIASGAASAMTEKLSCCRPGRNGATTPNDDSIAHHAREAGKPRYG